MGMWYAQAFNHYANVVWLQNSTNVLSHFLCDRHEGGIVICRQIPNEFSLLFRNHKDMARLLGVNIEKGNGSFIFIHFVAGNLTLNNLCKYRVLHTPQYTAAATIVL